MLGEYNSFRERDAANRAGNFLRQGDKLRARLERRAIKDLQSRGNHAGAAEFYDKMHNPGNVASAPGIGSSEDKTAFYNSSLQNINDRRGVPPLGTPVPPPQQPEQSPLGVLGRAKDYIADAAGNAGLLAKRLQFDQELQKNSATEGIAGLADMSALANEAKARELKISPEALAGRLAQIAADRKKNERKTVNPYARPA